MGFYNLSSAANLNNDTIIAGVLGQVATAIDAATAITITDGTFFRDEASIARAHTLADGTTEGDYVICYKTAGAGVGTITPANFHDGTSIPLTSAGDLVSFEWKAGEWELRTAVNVLTGVSIAVS